MVAISAISGVAVFMPIGVIARSGIAISALPKPNIARTSVGTRMIRRTATVTPSKAKVNLIDLASVFQYSDIQFHSFFQSI
jgi:hypothetical protein